MRKSSKTLVALVGALAMVAVLALPAAANQAGVIAFSGTADVTPGLFFPGLGQPPSATFSFGSGPTDPGTVLPPTLPTGPCTSIGIVSLGTCTIGASGTVTPALGVAALGPWCGLSTGRGSGSGTSTNMGNITINDVGWRVSAGSILPLDGEYTSTSGKGTGRLVGAVQAFGGQDCATTGASRFQVAGVAVLVQNIEI